MRLDKRMPRLLEQDNAVAKDVDEEKAAEPELLVHIIEAVIDEADRRPELLSFGQFGEQPILGLRPEFGNVGQVFVVDHDEEVEVREIAPDRILDPVAAGVTSEQDDLEKLAVAKPRLGPMGDRLCKALTNDLDDMR